MANLGVIEFLAERYEKALEWCEKPIQENSDADRSSHIGGRPRYVGSLSKARAAYEEVERRVPGVTVEAGVRNTPLAFPDDAERFAEGWRKAEMPE